MAINSEMNWKEFMQLFGLGAAALLASACLGGGSAASGSDSTPAPVATGFNTTLDLTATSSGEQSPSEPPGLAPLALHIPENGRQPNLHPARHWHAPARGRRKHWAFWVA